MEDRPPHSQKGYKKNQEAVFWSFILPTRLVTPQRLYRVDMKKERTFQSQDRKKMLKLLGHRANLALWPGRAISGEPCRESITSGEVMDWKGKCQ